MPLTSVRCGGQVDAAVLLHPLLADPRNFEAVLGTFETDADRDNVCHRLQIPFVKSADAAT